MRATATSTTVWTWSRSRCGNDSNNPRVASLLPAEPCTGTLHLRPAHPPAVAGSPRTLAGRRGMALPVVVGFLSAADAGAAQAGRRRSSSRGDAGHDAGGHRAARRPLLPDGHASLAGQLAAARPRGDDATRTVARVRCS